MDCFTFASTNNKNRPNLTEGLEPQDELRPSFSLQVSLCQTPSRKSRLEYASLTEFSSETGSESVINHDQCCSCSKLHSCGNSAKWRLRRFETTTNGNPLKQKSFFLWLVKGVPSFRLRSSLAVCPLRSRRPCPAFRKGFFWHVVRLCWLVTS